MASPVVQTSSGATGDSATPTITEPASAASGDLLAAIVGSADAGTAITGLTGWTQLGEGDDGVGNRYWYGWIARGASAPDLVAAAANARWTALCWRVDGHDGTTPIGTDHAVASGTSINPDPPNVDPGSSADRLSLVGSISEGKHTGWTPPTTPGTYTEDQEANTGGGGGQTAHIGGTIASRAYTGQAENPGTFTASRSDGYTAFTILVRPAPPSGQTIAVGVLANADNPVGVSPVKVAPIGTLATQDLLVGGSPTVPGYVLLDGTDDLIAINATHLDWQNDGLEVVWQVALDDWTPAGINFPVGKYTAAGDQRSWRAVHNTSGTIGYTWSEDGIATDSVQSSVTLPTGAGLADGDPVWCRITHEFNNGAGGNEVKFWYSNDSQATARASVSWTQLGDTETGGATTSMFTSTAVMRIGQSLVGKFYGTWVDNDFDGAGVEVANPDFRLVGKNVLEFAETTGPFQYVSQPSLDTETDLDTTPTTTLDFRLDFHLRNFDSNRNVAGARNDAVGDTEWLAAYQAAGNLQMIGTDFTTWTTAAGFWQLGRHQYRITWTGTTITIYKREPNLGLALDSDASWSQFEQNTGMDNVNLIQDAADVGFYLMKIDSDAGHVAWDLFALRYVVDSVVQSVTEGADLAPNFGANTYDDAQAQNWTWTGVDPFHAHGDLADNAWRFQNDAVWVPNQAGETFARKVAVIGTLANTDNLVPAVPLQGQTFAIGALATDDALLPVPAVKPIVTPVGVMATTDALLSAGPTKVAGVGVLTTQDNLVPVQPRKVANVGTMALQDLLVAVEAVKPIVTPVGTLATTDALLVIEALQAQVIPVGVLALLDSLLAVEALKPIVTAVGVLATQDLLVALTAVHVAGVGTLATSDSLLPVAPVKVAQLGTLANTDLLVPVLVQQISTAVTTLATTDLLLPVSAVHVIPVGTLAGVDLLVTVDPAKVATVGTLVTSDLLVPVQPRKLVTVGTLTGQDLLVPVQPRKLAVVGTLATQDLLVPAAVQQAIVVGVGVLATADALVPVQVIQLGQKWWVKVPIGATRNPIGATRNPVDASKVDRDSPTPW